MDDHLCRRASGEISLSSAGIDPHEDPRFWPASPDPGSNRASNINLGRIQSGDDAKAALQVKTAVAKPQLSVCRANP